MSLALESLIERLQVVVRQLDDLQVLCDSRRRDRFGQDRVTLLSIPRQHTVVRDQVVTDRELQTDENIGRGDAVFLGQLEDRRVLLTLGKLVLFGERWVSVPQRRVGGDVQADLPCKPMPA